MVLPVLQGCIKDPGRGDAKPFPDPPAQALLTVMRKGSPPISSSPWGDRGASQGISTLRYQQVSVSIGLVCSPSRRMLKTL